MTFAAFVRHVKPRKHPDFSHLNDFLIFHPHCPMPKLSLDCRLGQACTAPPRLRRSRSPRSPKEKEVFVAFGVVLGWLFSGF